MSHIQASKIGKGIWLPAIDYLGETLYETLINDDGGIMLRRPGGAACALKPLGTGDRGFAGGAWITCARRRGLPSANRRRHPGTREENCVCP